ncbi:MAG: NAD(P)/FAD-dependent oxidoreductase [Candidatus Woesearchaeota archaeon]|jgi:geranylgeranyl reductase family protein
MNITIIGAGPIGCYCSYLLAKQGHSVDIYEEHKEIGLPIQCTGLLTSDFDQFNLSKESFLVNTFEEIEVFSPGGKKASIKQKEYLVDRHKLDLYFAKLATEAGVKIHLQHSFLRKEGQHIIIKNNIRHKDVSITPEIIIAADGPMSKTAKAYGFYQEERVNYQGVQALVEGRFNPKNYQTFFGKNVCPDLFAWIVPESESRARIGLASTSKDARKMFESFMSNYNYAVIEMQAGMIPLYCPQQKLQQDNCYLLGDASTFVKATTLGGLIPGLKQAEILAYCLINDKNYEKEVKELRKRMNLHLRLRKIFNKFSDKDWDNLIEILAGKKMKKLLSQHTRDSPGPLVLKALLKEPRLWKFGKKLF